MTEPTASEADEREWWDDPAMPWKAKPSRAEIICLSMLGVVAVYGLVMLPLRPVILGLAPHVLGSLGYRTGLIMTGALARLGDVWWPLVWAIGSLMTIKFDWVYWWAGKLWGRQVLDVLAKDRSARTKRWYDRAWSWTHRYSSLMVIATFLPLPLPSGIVYAAVGAVGMSLRKFLIVCAGASLASCAAYLAIGYQIGEPAVALMDAYGRYLWIFSIVLLVGMIGVSVWRARRTPDGVEQPVSSSTPDADPR